MPGSASGAGDLVAWISADVGSLLLPLLLRWSEGRAEKKIDAPFNKGVAVYLLLQRGSGRRCFFLAGLGGEGESACVPLINDVEEFLAGRGGEEELSRIVANTSTSWSSYPCCCWCGDAAPKLFLSADRGGEGEGIDGVAASLCWRWFVGATSASSAPPSRWCSSWDAHQRGTSVGVIAPPLHHTVEGWPFSRRSSSTGRIYSASPLTVSAVCAPSGLFPGGVEGSRW
jgi:hypothetical protein